MRQTFVSFLVSLVVAGLTTLFLVGLFRQPPSAGQGPETAYARVMRTGVLRCAWYVMPPFFVRDPNTGAFSGIYYDVMQELGRQLNLSIEWTEEVAGGNAFEGLKTHRFDAVCAPFAPLPGRARVAEFSEPLSFRPVRAYVRANDMRFDDEPGKINDPAVRISVIEGQGAHLFALKLFPKAGLLVLPSFSDLTQNEQNVATGKADVSLAEVSTAERFLAANPGQIRAVAGPP